jgi:transcription antitermination factor NusG
VVRTEIVDAASGSTVGQSTGDAANWYAVQTCSNHEKSVEAQFRERTINAYLPLYESIRQWKDRRVRLELPLFPGYIFVQLALADRLRVLQVPSVVRLVGFGGRPSIVPACEIEALQRGLGFRMRFQPHPYLRVGHRVRVRVGPLKGLEGILRRQKNQTRLVISLDLIMRSVAVEIDAAEVDCVQS